MPLSIQYSKIQSYIAECACSFIFGFTVYSAILTTTLNGIVAGPILIGLSIGFVSVVIIFLFVDVTLAHFNPAITFAAVIFRKVPIISGFFYIIAQGIGFMIASLVVQGCFPGSFRPLMNIIRPKQADDATTGEVICIEMFLTGILVFSVFAMAANPYKKQKEERDKRELQIDPSESKIPDRSMFAPVVIGLTLGFLGYLGGSTSGGAFNPGIVWAPVLFSGHWGDSWKYWVGEFVGGFGGALIQVILFYPFY
ncbi:hypothetical protein VCUG_01543 [Vavraia culicis subsp. floridensis]|uniref:Aquaporin n=1 Tax=Vavraia culicis (isolate floridensis) TaxID=948595 RepID=L2GUI2_VAVCU|nr:uncharacterized protein VCUG_01543 [Vavraia culicis subsp. floridensis]ELA47012.1 hypothetical protein VCUG_01543 [Vavraia culicis subsp. floridensis]